jgi:hypothetical protein
MPKTSGMVQAKVVKAGGAGAAADENLDCAAVYAQFDPPIVAGTYSSVSSQRQEANADQGAESPFQKQQSEHMVPNSCLQESRGVNSSNIPGASNYTEGTGFTYNVYDGQSQGTEHKWLTDEARDFAQQLEEEGRNAPLSEWLDKAEQNCAEMLDSDNLVRTKGGQARSRIKDAQNKTPEERKALAQKAAKCLRMAAEAQFAKQGVKPPTPLRNGLAGGAPPPAPPAAGAQGGGAMD